MLDFTRNSSSSWQLLGTYCTANTLLPGGSVVKNLPANTRNTREKGSILPWGRAPGVENANPLQYSCLDNSINRGAWWATVQRGVTKSQTQLSTHKHYANPSI